jgi:hypothetical protein
MYADGLLVAVGVIGGLGVNLIFLCSVMAVCLFICLSVSIFAFWERIMMYESDESVVLIVKTILHLLCTVTLNDVVSSSNPQEHSEVA